MYSAMPVDSASLSVQANAAAADPFGKPRAMRRVYGVHRGCWASVYIDLHSLATAIMHQHFVQSTPSVLRTASRYDLGAAIDQA